MQVWRTILRRMTPVIVLATSVTAGGQSLTDSDLSNFRYAGSASNPAVITALAAGAYIWGLGPEYIWRFAQYNTIIGAPFNAFKYGSVPAAWNNEATNAGDASVLYVSGFV